MSFKLDPISQAVLAGEIDTKLWKHESQEAALSNREKKRRANALRDEERKEARTA